MSKPKLTLLVCALIATTASAYDPNNPCNLPTKSTYYTDLFQRPNQILCAPYPMMGVTSDLSTRPQIATTSGGVVAWWYCKNMVAVPAVWTGTWSRYITAVSKPTLDADPLYFVKLSAAIASAAAASNPTAALNALAAANNTKPMNDPEMAAAWCPAWEEIYRSWPRPGRSMDGLKSPPEAVLVDSGGHFWTIGSTGFALRDGANTGGRAVQLKAVGGVVYTKSPTGGYWWQWNGAWQRLSTVEP